MITSLITASNEELSDKIDECLKDESNASIYEAGSYYLLKIIVYQNELIRRKLNDNNNKSV
jgi:hypothetical protein